jgi:phage shock protein PspC (stress-responsive transcriptional regulator)
MPLHLFIKKQHFTMNRLYRSKKDRMLGGVCGGLGEYLEVDPTVIRLVWVVVTFISMGAGIAGYILAWIIIPEEDTSGAAPLQAKSGEN